LKGVEEMKKNIIIIGALLAVIIVTYAIAWGQMYITSKKYYNDAMKSYNETDYVYAIKGNKVAKEDESGYVFNSGFEQIVNIWNSPYALPKPKVYSDAQNMIDEIINRKIDIETAIEMFDRYFRMDNKGYLDEVLLRVADLYIQDNDMPKAKETLELIKEAFPNNTETQKIVEEKFKEINI